MPTKQHAVFICLLLAAVTLAVYWPAAHFDFINYDDPDYVIYNTSIQHGITGQSLSWAFATRHASNWHPVTWISHMADYTLYGLDPRGAHFTNILFHTFNVVLLFLVFLQLTGATWRSALVAALFGWHPLHVESVAWISERKDLLSTFFALCAISAYARYAKSQAQRRWKWYFLTLIFFILGLLSKPMVVTLPLVFLLLDFWPLQRETTRQLLLEKIPFFILAVVDGAVAVWAQNGAHSVISLAALPFSARIANALVSYVFYLWKMLWPVDLALPYSYSAPAFWTATAAGCLLVLISFAVMAQRRRRPALLVGWVWFVLTLLPVIGVLQVGIQPMADRYTYIPLIGIFIMAAWAIPASWTQWPRPGLIFGVVTMGVLLFLITGAEAQLRFWPNSITLFSHTVAVTRDNILAEYNLAEALSEKGRERQAIEHYQRALAVRPNPVEAQHNSQAQAHYNLGIIFRKHKQWREAEEQFRACVKTDPALARAHANLGAVLAALDRGKEAWQELQIAARLEPSRGGPAETLLRLANAYADGGRFRQAAATAQKAAAAALAEGRADVAAAAEKLKIYSTENLRNDAAHE